VAALSGEFDREPRPVLGVGVGPVRVQDQPTYPTR
jgi:hypothetical protein